MTTDTPRDMPATAHACGNCEGIDPESCLMNSDRREPDSEPATALARYIASHPVGVVQAAYRLLGMELTFEVRDDTPAPDGDGQAAGDGQRTRVHIDLNARDENGYVPARMSRADGPMAAGDIVVAYEPDDEVRAPAEVMKIVGDFAYLAVAWDEMTDDATARSPYAFTWAESVASIGTGATAIIEIDVHAIGHAEPVPVEIPLAEARTLHAMLGDVLAEHDPTPGAGSLRNRIAAALREHGMVHLGDDAPADEYDCCAAAVLIVVQPALDAERTRAEQAEDLLRVAHDTSNASEAERARAVQRTEEAEAALARARALAERWRYVQTRREAADAIRAALAGTEPTT